MKVKICNENDLFGGDFRTRSSLSQRLVKYDTDAGREVEAADIFVRHRDGQALVPICSEEAFGQAASLGAENQAIVFAITPICIRPFSLRRKIEKPRCRQRYVKLV